MAGASCAHCPRKCHWEAESATSRQYEDKLKLRPGILGIRYGAIASDNWNASGKYLAAGSTCLKIALERNRGGATSACGTETDVFSGKYVGSQSVSSGAERYSSMLSST